MRIVFLLADGGQKRRMQWDTQSTIQRPESGARGTRAEW